MTSEHDELSELAGLYVLDALTPEQRSAFDAHLTSCATCLAEVRSLAGVTDALARAVPQTDPPEALRARVIAAVAGAHARAEATAGVVSDFSRTRRAAPGAGPAGSGGMGMVITLWPWLAAAAGVVLAAALGVYAVQLRGRVAALDAELGQTARRAEDTERQVAELRRTAAGAESQVAVLAAPDLARIDLAGQAPVAPQASARAFWSRSRGLVFTASQLPALPPGRVYQLWVVTAQMPISAGLLQPDATGRVNIVVITPADIPQPTAMAVTVEPAGGVPAPTGDKYLVGLAN